MGAWCAMAGRAAILKPVADAVNTLFILYCQSSSVVAVQFYERDNKPHGDILQVIVQVFEILLSMVSWRDVNHGL